MQVQIKAIASKPQVSLTRATGMLSLKADDLADAAIVTALSKMLLHGDYPKLHKAIIDAAKDEATAMADGEDFVMKSPRKPRKSK